jgi:hypothetical protein
VHGDDEAAALAGLMVIGMILLVQLAIGILVAWLIYRANEALPAQHRKAESWQAFLLLIPLFNLVWNFILLARVSGGFQSYFQEKNDPSVGDCGASIGLWYSIAVICAVIPLVNCVAGPAALVLLIIYLVKISGLRTRVLAG